DPANRYRGLNEKEIEQFKLAQEIRDRYAVELRKEQRVAGDAPQEYKPTQKVNEKGHPITEKGQIVDSKGHVLDKDWPSVPPDKVETVRKQVQRELAEVKASDSGSVLDKLKNSGLSTEQQQRVQDALGEVREHYARSFGSDMDQQVNWIHTQ